MQHGDRWQYQNVALLDFENKNGPCANGTEETRDVVVGMVPPGSYSGLRFTLGVPFDLNHQDSTIAPSPMNLTSLFWTWQAGYKFFRVDLEPDRMAMGPMEACRCLGVPAVRQIMRHLLPNALSPVVVAASLGISTAIIAESTLSFLGLGFPPDLPTWGRILADGKDKLDTAPHWPLFPGLMIVPWTYGPPSANNEVAAAEAVSLASHLALR